MPIIKQSRSSIKHTLFLIFLWNPFAPTAHSKEPPPPTPLSTQKTTEQGAQGSDLTKESADDTDPQWGRTPPIDGEATILHGLDKTTARVFAIEAKHGQQIKFGTLRITVRGCKKNPPEEQPEAGAFLEILEEKTEAPPLTLFSGWMFSSSPAVSGLEHPVYDVWVTDCLPIKSSPPKALLAQKDSTRKGRACRI